MPEMAAMDLFVVPTFAFNLLNGFIIVRLDRRELVWIAVTNSPTADWIARQITKAFPWESAPRNLIREGDCDFGSVVRQRLRAMAFGDKPIAPRSPWQNGFVERLIGSIRRECLDHIVTLARRICAICCAPTRATITQVELISPLTKARLYIVRFSLWVA
jgi:hypothetical protein